MRRFVEIGVLLLGLLPLVAEGGRASAAEPGRPNILFLFADDWGRQASIYAEVDGPGEVNDVVRTPHFDRLARERPGVGRLYFDLRAEGHGRLRGCNVDPSGVKTPDPFTLPDLRAGGQGRLWGWNVDPSRVKTPDPFALPRPIYPA